MRCMNNVVTSNAMPRRKVKPRQETSMTPVVVKMVRSVEMTQCLEGSASKQVLSKISVH